MAFLKSLRRRSSSSIEDPDSTGPITLDYVPDTDSPALCSGRQSRSEGAMVSGYVSVKSTAQVHLKSLLANVLLTETILDAAENHCPNCSRWQSVVFTQRIYDAGTTKILNPGEHLYPITLHVRGNFPATFSNGQRRIDYEVEIISETDETGTLRCTRPIMLSRLCPWQIHDKRIYSNSSMFKAQLKIPQYTSRNDVFAVELIIEDRERHSAAELANNKWEVILIEWEFTENIQGVRLPCPTHSESLRTHPKRLLREWNGSITQGSININPVEQKPEIVDGKRRLALFFQCHTPNKVACDVKTPRGYKVWHTLACKVLCTIEATDDHSTLGFPACRDTLVQFKTLIDVCETNATGEVTSWDEMIAPAYSGLLPSPPGYAGDE